MAENGSPMALIVFLTCSGALCCASSGMELDRQLEYVYGRLAAGFADGGMNLSADPVQYGLRLTLVHRGAKAQGTLYHSRKKHRFSWVQIPNGDRELAERLAAKVNEIVRLHRGSVAACPEGANRLERGLKCWIGTDEAGKGDIFGPLVVAGFIADDGIIDDLAALDVRDSKQMKQAAISTLARRLEERYRDRIEIVEIGPESYNRMYPDFAGRGGISGVLGWAHAKAIDKLYGRSHPVEAAVVDRFSAKKRITAAIREASELRLILRPHAESNPAVAAASILARARFDRALDRMADDLGFRPNSGSGQSALDSLRRLAKENSDEIVRYLKMHFAPVKQIGLF